MDMNSRRHLHAYLLLGGFALGITQSTLASATDILKKDCAQCHNLTGPAATALKALWERKGPDLFYAGNKYKRDWLESWLQKPARIRPAGMYYGNHVERGAKSDEIKAATPPSHPVLSSADAKSATEALMSLRANSVLIKPGEYKPGSIPMSMGEMLFDKFRGCMACHEIEPGYGGLSGPEVHTAARRLQEDYMISFMRNPQAWDPRSFMPNKSLNDADLQKLVHYLRALSEENTK
ncbi:MAG TPA: c-type cytochrome [Gammaproteobacteria bacterium]